MHQVRAAALTGYADVARSVGLDPFAMLRRAKISALFLADPENRHSAAAIVDLLEDSASRSRCESFGLLMAEYRSFADLGPLSLLLQHLPTTEDVLRALIEYRRLLNDVITLECEGDGEVSVIRWVIAPGYGKPQVIDLVVALGYRMLGAVSRGGWTAEAVHFTHSPPGDLAVFRRVFAAPIEFDSAFNGYSCSSAAMRSPTYAAETKMATNARRLLDLVPLPLEYAPATDRVRHALAVLIQVGKASLGPVAAKLGQSPRTLQRLLSLEGTSFACLQNEVRKDLAHHYLVSSKHTVREIAALLGYSSMSAFGRWFASQFGETPMGWRRAMAGEDPPEATTAASLELDPREGFAGHFKGSPVDF
ncbi:MAG TPA: AraC family transcriptional regulator [Allosphingosinicella sp.]